MRKVFPILGMLIVALLLTACGKTPDFNGSRTGNDKELIMEYSAFNTTDGQELVAEAGDVIHAKIVIESGNLLIKIQKDDEEPIYESSDITISDEFDVDIDESGTYAITVTGVKAKGSVSFTVENNH